MHLQFKPLMVSSGFGSVRMQSMTGSLPDEPLQRATRDVAAAELLRSTLKQNGAESTTRMADSSEILLVVREAAEKRRLFLPHAIRQMQRPDRMITTVEVRQVI